MAFDLFFQRETDADWAMDRPAPLTLEFSPTERKTLKLLEPTTAAHAVDVVSWARGHGIPARLSHVAIYTPAESAKHYAEGRSGIREGRLDWHNVGRAFHVVLPDLQNGEPDREAYKRLGAYARSQGGEWLGDRPIKTVKGVIFDTRHFEYHPGVDIGTYRKSELAQKEYAQAQKRARMYT